MLRPGASAAYAPKVWSQRSLDLQPILLLSAHILTIGRPKQLGHSEAAWHQQPKTDQAFSSSIARSAPLGFLPTPTKTRGWTLDRLSNAVLPCSTRVRTPLIEDNWTLTNVTCQALSARIQCRDDRLGATSHNRMGAATTNGPASVTKSALPSKQKKDVFCLMAVASPLLEGSPGRTGRETRRILHRERYLLQNLGSALLPSEE